MTVPPDFIIKTGDMIQITIPPPAVVPPIVAPVPLMGTSKSMMVGFMVSSFLDKHTMQWMRPW